MHRRYFEKSELFFSFFFVVVLLLEAELIHSGRLRLTSPCCGGCCCDEVRWDCEDAEAVDCHCVRSV